VGYATIKALAAGMTKAGSTDTEALIKAFKGLDFMSPFGSVNFRALDHQSTLGLYVGKTALQGDKGAMTSYDYIDGAKLQPSDAEVSKRRPVEAQ
jgi:branched-chain amino acid transport system substrate-binding protein